jgi:hypothetical protein
MTKAKTTIIITHAFLKRESIIYIGKNNMQTISYMELYNHFLNEIKLTLNKDNELYNDFRLVRVFMQICPFDLPTYNRFDQQQIHNIIDTIEVEKIYNLNQEERKKGKLGYLNTQFDVNEIVFDEYKKIKSEVIQEERIKKAEEDSKLSLNISKFSFVIAIAAFILSGLQLYIDYTDINSGKNYKYETTTMHLDSQLVNQNVQIIELLKQKNIQKDTAKILKP